MRNGSLVEHASDQVHQHGNEKDDGKYAAGADTSGFVGFHPGTGVLRPHFEEVCTFVGVCANKRRRCLRVQRVSVAQE
jgi:hypothetical protein